MYCEHILSIELENVGYVKTRRVVDLEEKQFLFV